MTAWSVSVRKGHVLTLNRFRQISKSLYKRLPSTSHTCLIWFNLGYRDRLFRAFAKRQINDWTLACFRLFIVNRKSSIMASCLHTSVCRSPSWKETPDLRSTDSLAQNTPLKLGSRAPHLDTRKIGIDKMKTIVFTDELLFSL